MACVFNRRSCFYYNIVVIALGNAKLISESAVSGDNIKRLRRIFSKLAEDYK